jgi:hypothetical protein
VPGGAEGAVDEGAERAGPAEGGEDLAEQHGDVVRVAVAAVEVGVEGGRGARAPLEVLLQRPPLQPLAALTGSLRPGPGSGLGHPGGLARDRVMLAAAVRNRDGNGGGGGERARGRAGVEGEVVEGEEAPGRRHRRRGRGRGRGRRSAARGVDKTRGERASATGCLCTVRCRKGRTG